MMSNSCSYDSPLKDELVILPGSLDITDVFEGWKESKDLSPRDHSLYH